MTKKMVVTGSSGLIGSEVCTYFAERGWNIYGIDNNQRSVFFGPAGDTSWNLSRLKKIVKNFQHYGVDIRNRSEITELMKNIKPDAIVHCAAQPSHDLAAKIPFDDFDTNAVGTLNLLEAVRNSTPESPFVFISTNKVYGDGPNHIGLTELANRFEYADPKYAKGINETFPIDQCLHSLFGASKVAADILTQEYGRYFGMPTCTLRGGCLTGPSHSGVELHGFLSYLVKCHQEQKMYTVFGYKGKQVRDNIHSYDVARFIDFFINSPKSGEVYNIGGGKDNTCSIMEAFSMLEELTGIPMNHQYLDQNRIGDHVCYYSDLSKAKSHYPGWSVTVPLKQIFAEIVGQWQQKTAV